MIMRYKTTITAVAMLAIMAGFLFYEAWHDTATMDEAAHIPAGYSYVLQKDMRLNPEHPPLVKFLAGLSIKLLVKNINFPADIPAWRDNPNDQWTFGFRFLYGSGNDAEKIIHAGRIPVIMLTLILGWLIFVWSRELIGADWALLPLGLYAFSPNFIGHGHLVTTDIGATLGTLLGLYAFTHFLQKPTGARILAAGAGLGIALLLKFTTALLMPVLAAILVIWILAKGNRKTLVRDIWQWGIRFIAIVAVAFFIVWLVYLWHVWNYPTIKQLNDASFILSSFRSRFLVNVVLWMMHQPILRPLGQYFFGLLMNLQRSAGGNTTYFLGEISSSGWRYYFPIVYGIKETLPALGILLIGAFVGLRGLSRSIFNKRYISEHISAIALGMFALIYWAFSITSHLNIGVRHVFPTIPLLYIIAAGTISAASKLTSLTRRAFITIAIALVLWAFGETAASAPHHLAYFNEIVGGPANGYKYVVDSNLDWGQDLKYLRDYAVKNNIPKLKVDYFGGGDARYYLSDRFEPLSAGMGPQKGWLAISATFLQGGRGKFVAGFDGGQCCQYSWLNQYEPVTKIGYSIFVYHID